MIDCEKVEALVGGMRTESHHAFYVIAVCAGSCGIISLKLALALPADGGSLAWVLASTRLPYEHIHSSLEV
ncbi:hypothetical protein BESB_072080 [Besnoitia besnoiti]|uniref:Transmembrane protein n=1 Tax=Besnoitia besnoiti TaxID=94643 RepID=A0A2A9MDM8_BESBE|nr:uncharacterized protein BESB_072080 [Besnoitia besnoiti]PFH34056.1 hypothetical protein BESB_072080 [Besnoitia besnoiti]